jgi:putative ABC transport system permease protein
MDKWIEILTTMARNPLRTFLTSMGVFWGIFMLMLLMGAGNGLENGVRAMFEGMDMNSMYIWSQKTTIPYKGFKPGRNYNFKNDDIASLRDQVPELKYICPRAQLGGYGSDNNVSRNATVGNYTVCGDYPEYIHIEKFKILQGRFLNNNDLADEKKVCVIGQTLVDELYTDDEEIIGSYIKVQGVFFQVVGTFTTTKQGNEAIGDMKTLYIPFTTFQRVFNWSDIVGWFALSVKPGYDPYEIEQKVKKVLLARHNISLEDTRAVGSFNAATMSAKFTILFLGIKGVIFIVGMGTLFSGGIGVMNIMLISVAERTKEIGIRKAMGATPSNILSMIISEALMITFLSGFIGLAFGIGLIDLLDYIVGVPVQGPESEPSFFRRPEINASIAIFSMIVLIIIGALAGLYPAAKAVRIDPIKALRTE